MVGVERFELSIPKARDFKSLAYTNSATRPFLTFCIYYTPKFSESQNSNVSLWQNTQSTNALFVGILNAGSRTIHSISYSRKFSLEEWKTTNYRRCISSSNGCIFTGTAEFLVPSHTPPCFMRISFRKIISPSTLHIYYILNFLKIQILFSLSHSIFNHLRRRQAGRLGVDTQERSSLYGQIANFFPSQSLILLSTLKTISLGHFSSSKSK